MVWLCLLISWNSYRSCWEEYEDCWEVFVSFVNTRRLLRDVFELFPDLEDVLDFWFEEWYILLYLYYYCPSLPLLIEWLSITKRSCCEECDDNYWELAWPSPSLPPLHHYTTTPGSQQSPPASPHLLTFFTLSQRGIIPQILQNLYLLHKMWENIFFWDSWSPIYF